MLQRMDVLAKVFHQILTNIINLKTQFISYSVDSGKQMMTEIRWSFFKTLHWLVCMCQVFLNYEKLLYLFIIK